MVAKTNGKPQFAKKWWISTRPAEVKGGDLEKALHRAELALAAEAKRGDPRAITHCMKAVKGVAAAAAKSIQECDRKKHKEVIASLKKFGPLVKAEIQRLQAAKVQFESAENGGENMEPAEDILLDPNYLEKCVRFLRRRPLNFALCMPSKIESARFVFARKKSPKFLFTTLNKLSKKRKLGLPKNRMTFGTAAPDADDSSTLVLSLDDEAKQPMGLLKKGKKFLKLHKDQFRPFRKLKLVVNGKVVEDIPDPEDVEHDGGAPASVTREDQHASETPTSPGKVAAYSPTTSDSTDSPTDLRKQFQQARKLWINVRNQTLRDLEVIKAGVLNYYLDDPQQFGKAREKLRELDEVMDNLNDDLRDALQAYASTPRKQQDQLRQHGERAGQHLNAYLSYVQQSPLLHAIDQREFADVSVRAPLKSALENLAQTIHASVRD